MRPPGDDRDEMGSVNEISGDAPGGPAAPGTAAVTLFLTELRDLGRGPAPEPSAELAALLGGATPISRATTGHRGAVGHLRHARRVALIAAAAAAVLILTGVGAAHHALPGPAERLVSTVVNTITPFHITDRPPHSLAPASPPPSARHTAPSGSDDQAPTEPGHPTGSASGESGDESGSAGSSPSPSATGGSGDRSGDHSGEPSDGSGGGGSDGARATSGSGGGSDDGSDQRSPTPAPSSTHRSDGSGGGSDGGGSGHGDS